MLLYFLISDGAGPNGLLPPQSRITFPTDCLPESSFSFIYKNKSFFFKPTNERSFCGEYDLTEKGKQSLQDVAIKYKQMFDLQHFSSSSSFFQSLSRMSSMKSLLAFLEVFFPENKNVSVKLIKGVHCKNLAIRSKFLSLSEFLELNKLNPDSETIHRLRYVIEILNVSVKREVIQTDLEIQLSKNYLFSKAISNFLSFRKIKKNIGIESGSLDSIAAILSHFKIYPLDALPPGSVLCIKEADNKIQLYFNAQLVPVTYTINDFLQ